MSNEPIYSHAAEQAVLGAMMAQPGEVIDDVIHHLTTKDFFVRAHQVVFDALMDMYEHRSDIDVLMIHEYLSNVKNGHLSQATEINSPGILSELLVGFATHLNIGSYIRIVKDKSQLRQLEEACGMILKDIRDMPDSVASVLDRAESTIFDKTSINLSEEKSFSQIISEAAQETIEWSEMGGGLRGLPTGFKKLDQTLGGWSGSQLVVLGASMGVGKTACSVTFARSLLRKGVPGGMFSLEMTHKQLSYRILSGEGVVAARSMFNGTMSPEQRLTIRSTSEDIANWPFYIDCSAGLDISQMRSRARRWKRKYGIKFIIIDYAQIVRSRKFQDNKVREVADVALNCKEMAVELDLTVFLLSQLNCDSDEVPTKTSLKDSKAIAEAADVILLMHQVSADSEGHNREYQINIAKQREGMDGVKFNVSYQSWRTHFSDISNY